MKLATQLPYAEDPLVSARRVRLLEEAGIDMVWVAELYGFDAVSLLGYLAAVTDRIELASGILPVYSRTPALTAMTAAGLDAVSGGRFALGLGTSGPQVIEGFHGVPYRRPVAATRELIEICRKVWARERLVHDGQVYQLPLGPGEGTGLGKPLKLINRPVRADIDIYVASLGPANVAMTAELASGWLPVFYYPEKAQEVWAAALAKGTARRSPDLRPLEIVAGGPLAVCEPREVQANSQMARSFAALYFGGMGAKGKNFYNDLLCRYGFSADAEKIQNLYLSGDIAGAEAAVPEEFLAATTLIGDEATVRDRVRAFKESGVTRLNVSPLASDPQEVAELLTEVRVWAGDDMT